MCTFSHFPHQIKHVHFPSISRKRETQKISSIISVTWRIIWSRSSNFCYLIDMNIYTQNLPICSSGQHTYVTDSFKFFFVLQDLIDRVNSYFQRIDFQEFASYWLLTLYVTLRQKFFLM